MIYVDQSGKLIEGEPDMLERLAMLKSMAERKRNVDYQRDNLIRYMAALFGIDDDTFFDFLNDEQ